jgi:hypothetical protein
MSKYVVTIIKNEVEVDYKSFDEMEDALICEEELNRSNPEWYPTIVLK